MLTIGAQSEVTQNGYLHRRRLVFFVADHDGERVFEASASGTLSEMAASGGLVTAQDLGRLRAVRECVEFCGGDCYELSPAIPAEVERQRADDLNCLRRS